MSVQLWRERKRDVLEGIAGEGDGSRQGCGAYRHKTQGEPLPKPWTLNLEGRNLVRRFCWRFGIVRKEKFIPVQLEQKPSHLSRLFTQLSLSHQGLLVCSGLLGRRVVWVPMRSCACLHTSWKYRVWMGVWAFFDRSRNISREQSRIPGKLWQWRQCLCIHVSNVQLLDPVNWWEGFPIFCYRGAIRWRSCESEFSFFGRHSRFSEQVIKQHQLSLSAWFAMDGTMDVSCLQSTSQSYLQVLGGWWHQSPHVHRRECFREHRNSLPCDSKRDEKPQVAVEGLLANLACQCFCFCTQEVVLNLFLYLSIYMQGRLSICQSVQFLFFSSWFEQKKAKDSYHLDLYSSWV
jgi:hypothetical protein